VDLWVSLLTNLDRVVVHQDACGGVSLEVVDLADTPIPDYTALLICTIHLVINLAFVVRVPMSMRAPLSNEKFLGDDDVVRLGDDNMSVVIDRLNAVCLNSVDVLITWSKVVPAVFQNHSPFAFDVGDRLHGLAFEVGVVLLKVSVPVLVVIENDDVVPLHYGAEPHFHFSTYTQGGHM